MPLTVSSGRRLRSAATPPREGQRRRARTAALALLAALGALYPLLRRPILTWGATSEEAASRLPGARRQQEMLIRAPRMAGRWIRSHESIAEDPDRKSVV